MCSSILTARSWGGTPLEDINAGVRHLLKTCPEADADRLVAVGASYGASDPAGSVLSSQAATS